MQEKNNQTFNILLQISIESNKIHSFKLKRSKLLFNSCSTHSELHSNNATTCIMMICNILLEQASHIKPNLLKRPPDYKDQSKLIYRIPPNKHTVRLEIREK